MTEGEVDVSIILVARKKQTSSGKKSFKKDLTKSGRNDMIIIVA